MTKILKCSPTTLLFHGKDSKLNKSTGERKKVLKAEHEQVPNGGTDRIGNGTPGRTF